MSRTFSNLREILLKATKLNRSAGGVASITNALASTDNEKYLTIQTDGDVIDQSDVIIGGPKGVCHAEVSLTNAEVLALRASPKTLVAAPGAGKLLEFLGATLIFDYTAAYTESSDNLAVKYENGSGQAASETIEATSFVDATQDKITFAEPLETIPILNASAVVNKALVLHNTGDGEYGGGNASNVVRVRVAYRVVATGL